MLMMGALDGELNEQEQLEFKDFIQRNPGYRKEYKELEKIKEVTLQMTLKNPNPEVWDRYWLHVYNRIERGIGWILLSAGAIILVFYIIQSLLADSQLPTLIKIGIFCFYGGLFVLLISVLRERLHKRKYDPYKEIQI